MDNKGLSQEEVILSRKKNGENVIEVHKNNKFIFKSDDCIIPLVNSKKPDNNVIIISFKFKYFNKIFVIIVNITKLPNIISDVLNAFKIDFLITSNILLSLIILLFKE